MKIIYAPTANAELQAIWRWNARNYDERHADSYLDFLRSGIDKLRYSHLQRPSVEGHPGLHYILLRRKPTGHGHIVVYHCIGNEIHIKHVFHSAEDWQTKIVQLE